MDASAVHANSRARSTRYLPMGALNATAPVHDLEVHPEACICILLPCHAACGISLYGQCDWMRPDLAGPMLDFPSGHRHVDEHWNLHI